MVSIPNFNSTNLSTSQTNFNNSNSHSNYIQPILSNNSTHSQNAYADTYSLTSSCSYESNSVLELPSQNSSSIRFSTYTPNEIRKYHQNQYYANNNSSPAGWANLSSQMKSQPLNCNFINSTVSSSSGQLAIHNKPFNYNFDISQPIIIQNDQQSANKLVSSSGWNDPSFQKYNYEIKPNGSIHEINSHKIANKRVNTYYPCYEINDNTILTEKLELTSNSNEKPSKKNSYFLNKSQSSNNKKTRTKDKYRVVYNEIQRYELEREFVFSKYITSRRKTELASQLDLSQRQIKIWFQNRRAKDRKITKKKRTDVNYSDSSHFSDSEIAKHSLSNHFSKMPSQNDYTNWPNSQSTNLNSNNHSISDNYVKNWY